MALHQYYNGGFRVNYHGAPMKIFIKRSKQLAIQISMIEIARDVGCDIYLEDAHRFRFEPAPYNSKRKLKRKSVNPVPSPNTIMKDYYKGGIRKVIDGVPCRVATRLEPGADYRKPKVLEYDL